MKIAEFFIQLGIKGGAQTKEVLSGVHKGLRGVRDTSLETKAGVLGAILALEEMTRSAVNAASALRDFSGDTGYNTDVLQRWQYWAEMNGVSADNLANSFRQLQMVQAQMELGGAANPATQYFGLNQFEDKADMLARIQEKLHSIRGNVAEIGRSRYMLEQLGLGNMFAALSVGTVGFGGYTKNMGLDRGEIQKNLELGREFTKFWITLKGSKNKLVANELAAPIIDFVHAMTGAINELVELGGKFNKAMTAFSPKHASGIKEGLLAIAGALAIFAAPLGPIVLTLSALGVALDQIYKYTHGEKSILGGALEWRDRMDAKIGSFIKGSGKRSPEEVAQDKLSSLKPIWASASAQKSAPNVTVNATTHAHGVKDAGEVSDLVVKQVSAILSNAVFSDIFNNSYDTPATAGGGQ